MADSYRDSQVNSFNFEDDRVGSRSELDSDSGSVDEPHRSESDHRQRSAALSDTDTVATPTSRLNSTDW